MAIQSFKMGPGTLTLGSGPLDVSCQVVSCVVTCEENVDAQDDVDVLCGETLTGEEKVTYSWSLEATLVQDIAAGGVVAWSWAQKGVDSAFVFIPNTVGARKVTGTVVPIPISVGGEAKTRPTSDLTWRGKSGVDFVLAAVV